MGVVGVGGYEYCGIVMWVGVLAGVAGVLLDLLLGALRMTEVCRWGGGGGVEEDDTMTWCDNAVGELRSGSSWEEQEEELDGGGESWR